MPRSVATHFFSHGWLPFEEHHVMSSFGFSSDDIASVPVVEATFVPPVAVAGIDSSYEGSFSPMLSPYDPVLLLSPRQSSRHNKLSRWHKDYIVDVQTQIKVFPLLLLFFYGLLSLQYQSFLLPIDKVVEPHKFIKASKHLKWVDVAKMML